MSAALALALGRAFAQDGHGQPLPLGVQEALASTLGVRVPEVRVVRHTGTAQALDLAGADALAVGETVVLPPDLALDSAAGHALLTHELTHVLRRRTPDFVPAVARDAVPAGADEERVARHAEGRARQAFGGLPAPWEPMPFWETSAPAGPASTAPGLAPAPAGEPAAFAPAPPPAPAAPAAIHAAAKDRPSAAPAAPEAPTAAKGDGSEKTTGNRERARTPAPDLDQLARDVYDRLKTRLATELSRLN